LRWADPVKRIRAPEESIPADLEAGRCPWTYSCTLDCETVFKERRAGNRKGRIMKVLMVDVDGVLVHGRPEDGLPFATFLERDLGLSTETLQREFFKKHWQDIIVGREPMMPLLESALSRIAPHLTAEELTAYWFLNDSRLDRTLLDALDGHRANGFTVFLATNQEHHRARYLMEQLGLAAHVDGIVYSAALGHKKPSPAYFELAHALVKAAPHEVVFLDDKQENIDAARTFGWRAIHWTGGQRLNDEIAALAMA
jgi:putative hydrolase of the HAD superfamily